MDDELEGFKHHINLTEYAAGLGYKLDHHESSSRSAVMRHDNGDKVIVAREKDGHWVYFCPHDGSDNGTIIDFVQRRVTDNLGKIRQELRPWSGSLPDARKRPHPALFAHVLEPVTRDLTRILLQVSKTKPALEHPYLEERRAIPRTLLSSPRFAGKILIDFHGNAVFPHYDKSGLCGFELKNRNFTGFSAGGTKGLWFSATNKTDTTLVIAESGIDALSYASLYPDPTARYASTGGSLNPEQPQLIQAALSKMQEGSQVILATDNDEGGSQLALRIETLASELERADLHLSCHQPDFQGEDWNDVLRAKLATQDPQPAFPVL